ncbi:MAG: helix-turn-helix domain-containing protein [Nitrososphaerales archaeon]
MDQIEARPANPDSVSLTLSVPETAKLLGVSRDLVYELVAQGELPALRLGRRIVLPRRAIEELVEAACPVSGERNASIDAGLQSISPPTPLNSLYRQSSN